MTNKENQATVRHAGSFKRASVRICIAAATVMNAERRAAATPSHCVELKLGYTSSKTPTKPAPKVANTSKDGRCLAWINITAASSKGEV